MSEAGAGMRALVSYRTSLSRCRIKRGRWNDESRRGTARPEKLRRASLVFAGHSECECVMAACLEADWSRDSRCCVDDFIAADAKDGLSFGANFKCIDVGNARPNLSGPFDVEDIRRHWAAVDRPLEVDVWIDARQYVPGV